MRMIESFEVGEPVFLQWVPETQPEMLEFAGINYERGSFYVWKDRTYGRSRHELWPNEVGIGETPEEAEACMKVCFDFADLNE